MTIAVVQDFAGATLAQYDDVIEKMGITPGEQHPDPGCLFHWVTESETGIRVVDVWQDREQFDAWIAENVGPNALEAGFPNPPQNTFHEVHAYFT